MQSSPGAWWHPVAGAALMPLLPAQRARPELHALGILGDLGLVHGAPLQELGAAAPLPGPQQVGFSVNGTFCLFVCFEF